MENSNNSPNHSRFLIAAVLSMAVLFGWTYFFAPKPEEQPQTDQAANTQPTQQPEQQPAQTAPVQPNTEAAQNTDETANKVITIRSPLYEVKLDSKGATATSWILLKNKTYKGDINVFADGSTPENENPLQLISDKALTNSPQETPFRLTTGDENLDKTLNEKNYNVSVTEDVINLIDGQEQKIDFTLTAADGVVVTKSFVFRGDSYLSDLSVDLKRNGQPVPNTRLLIGASIGDHAINHHTMYHIESESVANINGDIHRHQGNYSFDYEKGDTSVIQVPGNVDWAGTADSYFAMAAIPSTPASGYEVRSTKYTVEVKPYFHSIFSWIIRSPTKEETRHLVTAYVPIATDGSVNKIFTGSKDYFLLSSIDAPLSDQMGRTIEMENLINFSSWSIVRWFVRPLSKPIIIALNFINGIVHNYGVAIILFTLFFYSLLFPLRWSQSKSFKKAAANAPKMKEIQDKIKDLQGKGIPADDPRMRTLQMDQLKMTKDALPIGGCLPMVLQFPLLIAFYTAVTVSLDIRQASFLWLPDLSAADPWHILEFAFATSMILAMKFTPTGPVSSPEQQMQQKMMTYMMPALMLWVMWTAPSGLLLYWLVGNIVSFGQQMIINKLNKPTVPPTTQVVDKIPTTAKKVKGKPRPLTT